MNTIRIEGERSGKITFHNDKNTKKLCIIVTTDELSTQEISDICHLIIRLITKILC